MKITSEKFVPTGWTKITTHALAGMGCETWPTVEGLDPGILDLSIVTQTCAEDDLSDKATDTTLNFTIGANEIVIGQHIESAVMKDGA